MDIKQPEPRKPEPMQDDCPYLLLDVRDSTEYEMSHIITGKSHTSSQVSVTHYHM